jgi:hypothetical protein
MMRGVRRDERAEAGTHAHPPLGTIAIGTLWRYQLCVCMRDVNVKEEHTRVHALSALLRAKDEFDKRERSEFPQ